MSKIIPLRDGLQTYTKPAAAPEVFYGAAHQAVKTVRPALPLYLLWPERIEKKAREFVRAFPGAVMFAAKTNPDEAALISLYRGGVKAFDVASIEEVRLIRRTLPKAALYFMHTVKAPEAIREAYFVHGVRHFSLDCEEELYKILRETGLASDLHLYVRLALPKNNQAQIDFSSKFGAHPLEAVKLLRKCRPVAEKLGLCFHVGTQITDPAVYGRAVSAAAGVLRESGVSIDMLDVGGGFPVSYPGEKACSLKKCVESVTKALRAENLAHIPLLAEPGRALVAEGGALVARVELRKGNLLYLNDGVYGGLFDAGPLLAGRFPVRGIRSKGGFHEALRDFRFAGPTCDSLDMMNGPFALPGDIAAGDWIVIGNLGAYSQSLRTGFNGFGHANRLCIYDSE